MSKKLWGGRFKKQINRDFFEFQKSIQYDYKLARYDIYHSFIHVSALKEAGIITPEEADKLISALDEILIEIEENKFEPDHTCEDIHTDIQNKIEKRAGEVSLKLHTLRSRNDQIVFDEKLYCYREGGNALELLETVMSSLNGLSEKYKSSFLPGYTHTRRAQVVSFRNYLGVFFNMFSRDFDRIDAFLERLVVYVGAGALAGSGIPYKAYNKAISKFLNRTGLEKRQYKMEVAGNPLDNVSDRDFVIEFLSILSLLQMHLSRMAEDFILYSTGEFDFFDLPEEFCTGSSLMPHKKNPDFLELVRGGTGKVYGDLISVLVLMKGLPLTYNRDMQMDKESLFSSVERVKEELSIMPEFISKIELKSTRIREVLRDEGLYATEVAEFLVFKDVPFKDAHTIVGKMVRYVMDREIRMEDMPVELLKDFHQELTPEVIKKLMNPEYAVSSKKSFPLARPLSLKKISKEK